LSEDAFKKGLDALESGPAAPRRERPQVPPPPGGIPPHPTVDALRAQFGDSIADHELVAGDEHVIYVDPARNLEILTWLRNDPDQAYDFLQDLTAVDYGTGTSLQVVYQLWSTRHKHNIRVKLEVPITSLEVDSVYYLWRAADWLEREVYDMFGVVFRGHPDLRRILMPYTYAEGHPLRKDFPLRGRFTRSEQTRRALSMRTEDHYSPYELEVARKLGQVLPDPMSEGGPGVPNQGMMPGIGGAGGGI
jgi:NADH-quinone oxidoreductase subunit C